MFQLSVSESERITNSIIYKMESTLHKKTQETNDHSNRMVAMVLKLGEKLNINIKRMDSLKLLAKFHDIGKVAVPGHILRKPGELTDKEYKKVKVHSEKGYRIAKKVPVLNKVAQGILFHHERWDGKGYPHGIKGKEIPFISRIIAIVDTYDVITHKRFYKNALCKREALMEINKCAGSQFDPQLAVYFIEVMQKNEI